MSKGEILNCNDDTVQKISNYNVYNFNKCVLNNKKSRNIINLPYRNETERFVFTMDIFTEEQCKELVYFSDNIIKAPWGIAAGKQGRAMKRRDVWRKLVDCKPFANAIFDMLRPYIPEKFQKWDLVGMNERFRFLKYYKGQAHGSHRDNYYLDKTTGQNYVNHNGVYWS
eukprot:UN30987